MQGLSAPSASPLTVATPMRTPVNEPGPCATANASTSSSATPQFWSRLSAMGSSVREWVRPQFWKDCAMSFSSPVRATEALTAEDSNARIFKATPPQS